MNSFYSRSKNFKDKKKCSKNYWSFKWPNLSPHNPISKELLTLCSYRLESTLEIFPRNFPWAALYLESHQSWKNKKTFIRTKLLISKASSPSITSLAWELSKNLGFKTKFLLVTRESRATWVLPVKNHPIWFTSFNRWRKTWKAAGCQKAIFACFLIR